MANTFTLLFHLLKSKSKHNKVPIYLRITVNKRRAEIALKRFIEPDKWNAEAGCARGNSELPKTLNTYLDVVRSKIYEHHKNLIRDNKPVTAANLKNAYLGLSGEQKTVVEVFERHNKQMKQLIGKEYAEGTYQRFETTLKHIIQFMEWKYNISDIPLSELNHEFITELDHYFRTVRNCANNSTVKYIKNFKKIIQIALANEWIKKNPFANFKARLKEVERYFLTEEELQQIINKKFSVLRVALVRDIFVFSCYTGLAYSDVAKLTSDNIVKRDDNALWLQTKRTKTNTRVSIPLLPTALQILNNYSVQNPGAGVKLLPILSNQRMNTYLKEIADVCGIQKELTFHIARHTFATTVTLSNGVPIESVSKMLGHKSIAMTQHYAKIIDRKVGDDMTELRKKLGAKEP